MIENPATYLRDLYGMNPQDVGAEDGTEDDFGDLIGDALDALGFKSDDWNDAQWQRVQDAAARSDARTMEAFLGDLARAAS